MHRNDPAYPDHGVFRPERWLLGEPTTPDVQDAESSDLARAPHTFGPFSLGPRACAGRNMAYAELADTVARTLVDA